MWKDRTCIYDGQFQGFRSKCRELLSYVSSRILLSLICWSSFLVVRPYMLYPKFLSSSCHLVSLRCDLQPPKINNNCDLEFPYRSIHSIPGGSGGSSLPVGVWVVIAVLIAVLFVTLIGGLILYRARSRRARAPRPTKDPENTWQAPVVSYEISRL